MSKKSKTYIEQLSIDSFLENTLDSKQTESVPAENHSWSASQNRKTYPVHLLEDFNQFMIFVKENMVQITKKSEYISPKYLLLINDRLSIKAQDVTAYTKQEYYPYIHFFYHLALAGGLIEKIYHDSTSAKPIIKVTERWNLYNERTETEKYIFLLETFWIDVNWAGLLGQRTNFVSHILPVVFEKLMDKDAHFRIDFDREKESLLANLTHNWHHFFLFLEWLGIWVCEKNQEKMDDYGRKNYYFVKSITLTDFGKKIVPILWQERKVELWNLALRREHGEINPIPGSDLPDMEYDPNPSEKLPLFYQAFSHIFDKRELRETFPRIERAFIPGVYRFKVALDKNSWCEVVLDGEQSMGDLSNSILRAFGFDHDHLYSFFMDGIKWSHEAIVSPADNSGEPIADEVKIGSVGLRKGKQFLYLYDYGEEWTFKVTVKHID
ncbi:plasmid pRiA4b ORF-3 family protein [Bacillaceae bacterium S4-13-58]